MKRKRARAVVPPHPPEDHSWAARVEGLKRERPAQLAVLFALGASVTVLAGWTAVLIPAGGSMRFNPGFWLLAAPLMVWWWSVQSFAPWAAKTVWLVLLLAPCLALLAMLSAPVMRHSALLDGGVDLATPLAMLIILGLTTVLACAGLVALRRSSLPGGIRPATYVTPGTPLPGAHPLPEDAGTVLMAGSLPFSGALINGMFFAMVAMLDPIGSAGSVWPGVLVGAVVFTVGGLVFRGGFRLARRRAGAVADLRRGWWLGMSGAIAALGATWAWPTILTAKLGFSCFMIPMALAAIWGGRKALRELPMLDCVGVKEPMSSSHRRPPSMLGS